MKSILERASRYKYTIVGFLVWLLALIGSVAAWIYIERAIWGSWPPKELGIHYLHLIRGILIALVTSVVAAGVIFWIKARDIAQLQTHQAFSDQLIEKSQSLVVGIKPDGEILVFNQRLEELTSYSYEEVQGKNWFELFVPASDRERVQNTILNLAKEGSGQEIRDYQNSIMTRSGERREIVWNGTVIKNENGKVIGVMGLGRDITERQVLKEKLALFSSAFEHSTDAILITDLQGRMLEVNQAFTRLYGYSREETIGNTTHILRSPHSTGELYRNMWQSINARGEWKGEVVNQAKDGIEIPIWLSITPIIHDGAKIGYMEIEMDMREKKDLEKRALEAERLAAAGRISSQVAHEVRNPLSSISLNVELLREELEGLRSEKDRKKYEESASLLKSIEREVDRLAEIAGAYLKFSRLPQHRKQRTDLNELVKAVLDFIREEARQHNIRLAFHGEDRLPAVWIDPKQMEQALLNLIKNAFEAMPEGGRVEIGLRWENGSAVLYVRDEGTGIDEETQRKMFDPFFTTKEKGSGLGLSLVRQVVVEHDGKIWCESVQGKGSAFYIRIPALTQEVLTK